MKDIFEYDVFLSFASSDEEFVKPIWQELSLSGLRVFWSDESLKKDIGQSFFTTIQDALTHSRHFILICTSSSMGSNWVREEYETFFSQCYIPSGRERRLVLFSGKNFDRSTLPTLLKNIQFCDSVKEIITTIGGMNIQALINENNIQKQQLSIAYNEITELKTLLAESGKEKASLQEGLALSNLEVSVLTDENSIQKKQFEIADDEITKLKKALAEYEKENKYLKDKLGLSNREVSKLTDELNSHRNKKRSILELFKSTDELKPKKAEKAWNGFNPIVDQEKCTGCEECVDVCPVDAFEIQNEKSVPVNAEECMGCDAKAALKFVNRTPLLLKKSSL
jgi:ferredoxin